VALLRGLLRLLAVALGLPEALLLPISRHATGPLHPRALVGGAGGPAAEAPEALPLAEAREAAEAAPGTGRGGRRGRQAIVRAGEQRRGVVAAAEAPTDPVVGLPGRAAEEAGERIAAARPGAREPIVPVGQLPGETVGRVAAVGIGEPPQPIGDGARELIVPAAARELPGVWEVVVPGHGSLLRSRPAHVACAADAGGGAVEALLVGGEGVVGRLEDLGELVNQIVGVLVAQPPLGQERLVALLAPTAQPADVLALVVVAPGEPVLFHQPLVGDVIVRVVERVPERARGGPGVVRGVGRSEEGHGALPNAGTGSSARASAGARLRPAAGAPGWRARRWGPGRPRRCR